MAKVVRVGDPGSHGGAVSTGSPDVTANGIAVARVGDTYNCPIHGPNPITSGSPDTFANGQAIARVGDSTACGATLVDGSPDTFCN
jgi:uncharacterized Zn-binding protein involved in type VI secretion